MGEMVAVAGVDLPGAQITGTEDIDPFSAETSDEDERKVNRAGIVLDQALRERYPSAAINYDAEEPRLTLEYREEGLSTQERMHERAWKDPHGPDTFANEASPSMFESQSLSRLFRKRMDDTSMVSHPTMHAEPEPEPSRTSTDDWSDATTFQEFVDKVEVQMPMDRNVQQYAERLAYRSDQMRSLAESSHCSTNRALEDLNQATPVSTHRSTVRERFEAHQLSRWIERRAPTDHN